MIIEENSLAEELKGVSRYEKVAYISIFIIGLLIIKTDDAYITCQTSNEFQGIIWEMGLIPLAFIGDVTKNLNINIFIVGLVQFLACQLRLQFTMIYLLYKILGQGKMRLIVYFTQYPQQQIQYYLIKKYFLVLHNLYQYY
ncbi:unnamed protein product [Paramecium pentaurelia]|uniref:Uncharacterized protein n=1 Tax=Paramecium pentaurelia TaxID=43138 RepID=A0A8S1SDS3_9CILI|nr:unnamed protein product [Paramecium pentaurelia]